MQLGIRDRLALSGPGIQGRSRSVRGVKRQVLGAKSPVSDGGIAMVLVDLEDRFAGESTAFQGRRDLRRPEPRSIERDIGGIDAATLRARYGGDLLVDSGVVALDRKERRGGGGTLFGGALALARA